MALLELHRDAPGADDSTAPGHDAIRRIDTLVIAGWTGRDAAAVQHHVRELEAIGVAPPSSIPLYYRVAASLLTTASVIDVVGPDSSGEVEPMLVRHGGTTFLGLASDHTDRALEAHSVALSKQACAKPCAAELWPFEAVADRLDSLGLRSWIRESENTNAEWTLYQEGTLSAIRPLAALLDASPIGKCPPNDVSAMLCGTLPAIGGVRPGHAFRYELHDPFNGRTLEHEYAVRKLPIID